MHQASYENEGTSTQQLPQLLRQPPASRAPSIPCADQRLRQANIAICRALSQPVQQRRSCARPSIALRNSCSHTYRNTAKGRTCARPSTAGRCRGTAGRCLGGRGRPGWHPQPCAAARLRLQRGCRNCKQVGGLAHGRQGWRLDGVHHGVHQHVSACSTGRHRGREAVVWANREMGAATAVCSSVLRPAAVVAGGHAEVVRARSNGWIAASS